MSRISGKSKIAHQVKAEIIEQRRRINRVIKRLCSLVSKHVDELKRLCLNLRVERTVPQSTSPIMSTSLSSGIE